MNPEGGRVDRPLYVIVDREYAGDDSRWLRLLHEIAAAARDAPMLIQVRAKGLPAPAFESLAARARAIVTHGPPLVLNGDAETACRLGYDGVHWPEAAIPDAPSQEAATLRWRTAAVHSMAAVRAAEAAGATALVFAPVFAPGWKPGIAAGLDALRTAVDATALPVYALGGITPERVADCRRTGAAGVAVVSGVLGSPSPVAALTDYQHALDELAACR